MHKEKRSSTKAQAVEIHFDETPPTHESQAFTEKGAKTRHEIIAVARDLFECQGFARTTIVDVANKMGLSRGVVYYHFKNKDILVEAVVDDYIQDLAEMLQLWEETREKGDSFVAVQEFVLLIKRAVFEKSDLRKYLSKDGTADFYANFVSRAIKTTLVRLNETTVKYYATHYPVEIEHLYEMFYILFAGMSVYMRNHPDADIDKLTEIAAQILRIDLKQKLPEE